MGIIIRHRNNGFYNRKGKTADKRPCEIAVAELNRRIVEANRDKVYCRFCGRPDNNWPERRGLCLDCYCKVVNSLDVEYGGDKAKAFRELTDEEIMTFKPQKKGWAK